MPTKPSNETTRQSESGYPSKTANNPGRGDDNLAPVQPGKRGHDLDADLSAEKRGNAVVKDEDEDDENSAHDRAERVEGDDEDQRR